VVATLWDLVVAAASADPDRVLVADQYGRELTAAGLRDAAEQSAAGLCITSDDVVSWQLPTVLESVVLMAALARIGALQNPIIPQLREREIQLITTQLGTTKLIVPARWRGFDHAAMGRAVAADAAFEVVTLDLQHKPGSELRLPPADGRALSAPPAQDTAWRWAYYTSGTTAQPKGARHTDASLIASSHGVTDRLGIRAGDVYPIAWPITHIGGATMLIAMLCSGGRLVLFDRFDPTTTPWKMADHGPTILGTAVPFFRAYLGAQRRHGAAPLYPRLRAFVAGGALLPVDLVTELAETFPATPVINSWGLTEFPVAASTTSSDPPDVLTATVGRPTPGVAVRVVDGELRLKGPQQFLGYVDPALDADALDERGWLKTGDLGLIDESGFIAITGRAKDVIIRNAENISALEIEEVLLRHPGIADASVIGLPDARTGERVCAVVVSADGCQITLDSVIAHCVSQGLPRQKSPEQLAVVGAIARNPMGKVVKSQLCAELLGDLERRPG
jgi:acyl-CoA synthetase (AMP-forming)/AMP-acid ligase II